MPIRVLLYEDNDMLRQAFAMLVGGTPGYELVGAFVDADEVIRQVEALKPDVVLMDLEMPGHGGIWATQQIHQRFATVEVLILTVFDDDENIFKALCAGANGYFLKDTSPADILAGIRQVYEGGAPMTPIIARKTLQFLPRVAHQNSKIALLTDREREILEWLAKGHSYKMVAAECNISIDTVRTHIKRIYEKLHVHSVTEAVAVYWKN
jgi:DNA-binding NarL/FixJ family response regulator